MDITAISAALSSANALLDIAKGISSANVQSKIVQQTSDIQQRLIELQQIMLALQTDAITKKKTISELEKQLADKENCAEEAVQYHLVENI